MGKVMSLMMRPIKRFNIENRAHRVISKEKPVRAPLPSKAEEQLHLAQKINPKFMDEQSKKDTSLDERLKSVYVRSTDPEEPEIETQFDPTKPLPQYRSYLPDFEYGYAEPSQVLEGKCTLRQAVEFLTKRSMDRTKYTSDIIARDYKLDKEVVDNILEYFQVHKIAVPPDWKPKPEFGLSFIKHLHPKK